MVLERVGVGVELLVPQELDGFFELRRLASVHLDEEVLRAEHEVVEKLFKDIVHDVVTIIHHLGHVLLMIFQPPVRAHDEEAVEDVDGHLVNVDLEVLHKFDVVLETHVLEALQVLWVL